MTLGAGLANLERMTTLKAPLLSLEATGTLGDSITFTRPDSKGRVRRKPIPTDRRTLLQMYQRWLYQDQIRRWNALTTSEKAAYRASASRKHQTPLASFLKDAFHDLSDEALYLKLDTLTDATTLDSSKNGNNASVVGAYPLPAVINNGFFFDGVDDILEVQPSPSLSTFSEKTVLFWLKPPAFTGANRMLYYGAFYHSPFGDFIRMQNNENRLQIYVKNTAGVTQSDNPPFTPNIWNYVGYTWDGTNMWWLVNGYRAGTGRAFSGTMACSAYKIQIGRYYGGMPSQVQIDDFRIFNRYMPLAEYQERYLRRYP